MTTEPPHHRRMALSMDRSARLEEELRSREGKPPAPGDLFVLRATADLPVEWALLERAGGRLLAVPADAGPPAGTADVEVPADTPGGPLSLRCRFSLWLDATLFESELRSGVLAQESVTEALQRVRQIESGTLEGSPLAEEVDADPEYQDWSRDISELARVLASEAKPTRRRSSGGSPWGIVHQLAAALAVLSIGLSVWVVMLRREVDHLSEPVFNVPSGEVVLGGTIRGGRVLSVPEGVRQMLLLLVVDSSIEEPEGRFEIVDRQGEVVWRSPLVRLSSAEEIQLLVPRRLLPDGLYRVRLLPASGGEPLGEDSLKVETREGP